ncbi:hypothetical protein E9232_003897 [Inquilinus ginsengisoli]|uniref:RiboL-PSP-HEPN domain-containing protein n=1 Tax=Inquilinus ginsengisoli TaxID=363840 RepID=A0ABU1JRY0_9PROT|nr:HEPN domain-containing protein [Inquilinus ginsengisoli]MDR6291371.1 hypothetical protein [Inquilinus ginsengisoli]
MIEIHEECTGREPGRRHGYDALNRSTVILSVAAWEGFVEELLEGAVGYMARNVRGPSSIPKNVRDMMISFLYERNGWSKLKDSTKSEIWSLTGNGWRSNYISFAKSRISSLNTPNHANVKKLYSSVIGVPNCSEFWNYGRWSSERYIEKLEELMNMRHRIAHGSIGKDTVGKTFAKNAISLIEFISEKTDRSVKNHVRSIVYPPKTISN